MILLIIDRETNHEYTTIKHLMRYNYVQIHLKVLIDLDSRYIRFYINQLILFFFQQFVQLLILYEVKNGLIIVNEESVY